MALAEIAHLAGYSDQPHMNRDFRDFAGESPGAHRAQLLSDDGGVRDD